MGSKEKNKFKCVGVQIHECSKGVMLGQHNYRKTLNIPDKRLFKDEREIEGHEKNRI